MFLKKVKAGALQYVLVISVLIAIIVFAFIALIYLQRRIQLKNSFYKEAIENVQFGFDFISQNDVPYNTPQEQQFSNNELEKTTLLKEHWGVFNKITVTSTVKNESFQKIGLTGGNNIKRDALYLKDNNQPLVLVGDTKIIGDVALPERGVKGGNISGTSYYGNQLIFGNQKLSSATLPAIDNLEYIKGLIQKRYLNEKVVSFELEEGLKKRQLFSQSTAVFQASESIYLRNVQLQGNIIVHSNKAIVVDTTSLLEDVILIAPVVKIKSNVIGSFQVLATKKIEAARGSKLKYPSALVLFSNEKLEINPPEENSIAINENCDIKGVVLFHQEKGSNYKSQVVISKNSTITGEVYCNQNLELLGSVYGSVYASSFITKHFGSVYVNAIYNGVINVNKLPEQYCGLQIGNSTQKVAKWLY